MRSGRRNWRIVGLIVIALLLGMYAFIPRSLQLISRATLLIPAGEATPFYHPGWPSAREEPGPFFWMSDHELLYPNGKQAISCYDTLTEVTTDLTLGSPQDNRTLAIFQARRRDIERRNEKRVFTGFSGKVPIANTEIALPLQGRVLDTALSTRGDRRAWLLEIDYISPFQMLMKRLMPSLFVRARHRAGLWVSRADGTDMRLLGFMPPWPGADDPGGPVVIGVPGWPYPLDWPWDLQWKPDGKQLSFVYKGALYTIPAN